MAEGIHRIDSRAARGERGIRDSSAPRHFWRLFVALFFAAFSDGDVLSQGRP
jgi:hypothetical protein